jgi:hypothetical protein
VSFDDLLANSELGFLRLLAQADGHFDLEELRVRVGPYEVFDVGT